MSSFLGDVVEIGSFGLIDGGDISGENQAKAATQAANIQAQAGREALAYTKEATAPYRSFGENALTAYQPFLSDPSGYSFLQNNPMFSAALEYSGDQLKTAGAAGGKFNSGGMRDALFRNYLALGDQFTNQAANRILSPIQIGANAATNTATQGANLLTSIGATQAGGVMGSANAQQAAFNNLLNIGGTLGGAMFLSDERTKEDIKLLGKDSEGNNVYEYSYKHDEKPKYVGYMAQEVAAKDPAHVGILPNKLLAVSGKYEPVRIS